MAWILTAIVSAWELGLGQLLGHHAPPLTEELLLLAFLVAHGLGRYSGRALTFYAVVCAIVSNIFENSSVLWGFPFGYYVHNSGPKLFNVPFAVTFWYVGMGYVCWVVAQTLVHGRVQGFCNRLVYFTPLVASFVFSAWDLCDDAIMGSLEKAFTYRSPGAWFGTPAGNYFGWLLSTFLIYLPFSLYLRRKGPSAVRADPGKSWWAQPVLVYLAIGLGIIIGNIGHPEVNVVLANGKIWNSGDVRGGSTLATIFTMIFLSLLSFINLYNSDGESGEREPSPA